MTPSTTIPIHTLSSGLPIRVFMQKIYFVILDLYSFEFDISYKWITQGWLVVVRECGLLIIEVLSSLSTGFSHPSIMGNLCYTPSGLIFAVIMLMVFGVSLANSVHKYSRRREIHIVIDDKVVGVFSGLVPGLRLFIQKGANLCTSSSL